MKNDRKPKAYVPQELVHALEHLQELAEKHRYNMVGALEVDNHDASRPVEAEGLTVFTAISPHRTIPMQLIYRFAHDPDPDTVLLDMYLDLVNIGTARPVRTVQDNQAAIRFHWWVSGCRGVS